MVLEATIVCIDNSEWMRNGDYPPSRLAAQADAANLICSAKVSQNRENTVGLLTMAGKSARMLVTQTNDDRQIITSLHQVNVDGHCDYVASIRKAQLALKHRQNQQQRQRIVVFCGSPIEVEQGILQKVGTDLRRNGVALDLINFGEEDYNGPPLETLLQAVNKDNNSHLVTVPPARQLLSDVLLRSAIMLEEGAVGDMEGAGVGDGSANEFPFGVDPSADPELAMALTLSMAEETERQAQRAAEQQAGEPSDGDTAGPTAMERDDPQAGGPAVEAQDGDQDLYDVGHQAMPIDSDHGKGATDAAEVIDEEMDEDMKLAIEISKADQQGQKEEKGESKEKHESEKK